MHNRHRTSSSSGTSTTDSSSSRGGNDGALSPQHSADAEFAEAEQAVEAAASKGLLGGPHSTAQHSGRALLRSVLEVAAVMFLAEWGDRSMLATVALGAAQVGALWVECSLGLVRT
jgi:putative Ca2+/H+ antiporter (TMEM165/GDT1 family)